MANGTVDLNALPDGELLRMYVDGDQQAFTTLYNKYNRSLYRFCMSFLRVKEDAEDIVQETFVRVVRHAHRFKHEKKFFTWICEIAKNQCKNSLRNKRRKRTDSYDELEEGTEVLPKKEFVASGPSPLDLCHLRLLAEEAGGALKRLPALQQTAVIYDVAGCTEREMAILMDVKLGTVKSRCHRGKRLLVSRLNRRGIHGAN